MPRRQDGPHCGEAIELSLVVPLYNEQENVRELYGRTVAVLRELGLACELLFIDDGSTDATPGLLAELATSDSRVGVLTLSRNFGHQAAVSAGLEHARGRAVVVLDGDLQDPPELIPALLDRWRAGADVVYAVRRQRGESLLRRLAYAGFYRLLRLVSDLDIPLDSGDFSLMDRKVVEALRALPERARFVRGLRSFVGFRQVPLEYDRPRRGAGDPKYTFGKLLGLAADGLVSFSGRPLRWVTGLGLMTALAALTLIGWVLADAWFHRSAPRGWASILGAILFIGAVQMISLGLIGEYVRLIFLESKQRPAYVVARHRPARLPRQGASRRVRGIQEGIDARPSP